MNRRSPPRALALVSVLLVGTAGGVAIGGATLANAPRQPADMRVYGFRFEAKAGSREQLIDSGGLKLWGECVGVADVGTNLSVSYRTLQKNAVTSVSWETARGDDYLFFDDDFDRSDGVRDLLGGGAEGSQGEFVFSTNRGAQTTVNFVADSNRPGGRCLFAGTIAAASVTRSS